ncbi:tetratricopeptide repeat protein 36-like protein [Leptotrombidium deliense]|uniref:Tetratricopeptide repeat protein 36-like protein n=1 Tax=Leptotrombidium deliense TaxID=299467 RepID=A0A443SKN9_9ACAR|nr:tetratricopeptide repeat protein 36-like protein [Leptotrombidium deliense]
MVSVNDKAVLNAIFNPLLPSSDFEEQCDAQENQNEKLEVSEEMKQLELKGVSLAENGDFDEAVHCFKTLIELCPQYASAYNNLAQTLRLKGDTTGAMQNLETAIQLSAEKSKTRRQALCQRALIHRLLGNEDQSLKDFKEAANCGSEFAKQQVVLMNPYSALCNQMLSQMISELQKGQQ